MFKCHVCGSTESKAESVTEVFRIGGQFYLVEGIPATICASCGEEVFSRENTENIREMLHGGIRLNRSISVDVFAYYPKAS
ncbi:MAG: YgiT-type zinc finger protein [Leptolyngbyaceae cyanobacterium SM2_5_2]|nr:YgiT-type zinc finger protein [Leptolyngbyaceae cyanobacterium SM2_5_2]